MVDMNKDQKTIIAAILHDIGKIAERLGEKGNHAELTKKILEEFDEELAEIAYGHHSSGKLNTLSEVRKELKMYAEIVCKADNISAGIEREGVSKSYLKEWASKSRKKRPILSILSTIDIGKGDSTEKYFYVRELTLEPYYLRPKSIDEAGVDYSFYYKLVEDLRRVFYSKMSFEKLLFTISNILKKYTFFVPTDTFEREDGSIPIPDISLYEHLRLTSMFTCAMLVNVKKFLLIMGDVSGLQKFIAKISSKKALRFLKGRSFFLELLTLAAAFKICKELGIPPTQILSATAGNFTIIAPASDEIKNKLLNLAKKLNEELLTYGLYIALAWIEKSYEDAKEFEKVVSEVEGAVEVKKFRKYSELLLEYYDKVFFPDNEKIREKDMLTSIGSKKICEVCDSLVSEDEISEIGKGEDKVNICKMCKKIYDLSEKLVNVARIAEKSGGKAKIYIGLYEDGSGDISIFGIGFKLENLPENLTDADYVFMVNDIDFLEDIFLKYGIGCGFRFFNVHVRDTSVDRLANASEGAKYLGILKMDGDDMGRIFSEGVKNWWIKKLNIKESMKVGKMTPARYATLSSLFEIFFGFCVSEICRKGSFFTKEKYAEDPQVYVVFSGGDDIFVLGPWNQIVDLAVKIEEEFSIFTANPNVTISAAVTIVRKKFPVYKSYFATLESLEEAKTLEGKSAISLFGGKLKFKSLNKARELTDFLFEHISNKRLPRSVIFAILACLNSNGKYRRKWRSKYVIAGLMERYKDLDLRKLDKSIDDAFASNNFSPLLVSLRWVELLTRSEVVERES